MPENIEVTNAVTDLLEVPSLCVLLVLAGNALILNPQLSHDGPQIRALSRIHLHVHLLVSQTRLQSILLLQRFKEGENINMFLPHYCKPGYHRAVWMGS